ncbi:hypothetical protein WIW50_11515 [Flavobacteriaceae bacterium 3-367]
MMMVAPGTAPHMPCTNPIGGKLVNMSNKHDIKTYQKLSLGASFFLEEAFKYLDTALKYEFASILFGELLETIEPNQEDRKIIDKLILPATPIGMLQFDNKKVISEKTIKKIYSAWDNAQKRAENEKYKFGLNHSIDSTEILGHINNMGFFMETIINRHLLFLNQSRKIDDFSYSRISTSRIMERIVYIFKDELNKNRIHLNEVQNLFRLRNKTVHYTPDNAKILKPMVSELIKIWNQCSKLLEKLEEKENFVDGNFSKQIIYYSLKFQERWI